MIGLHITIVIIKVSQLIIEVNQLLDLIVINFKILQSK